MFTRHQLRTDTNMTFVRRYADQTPKGHYKPRFTLVLEPDNAAFLNIDKIKYKISKTGYLNKFIRLLADLEPLFSGGSKLAEFSVYSRLSRHPTMQKIPVLAAADRREPEQQMLFFLEKGMRTDEIEKRKLEDEIDRQRLLDEISRERLSPKRIQ